MKYACLMLALLLTSQVHAQPGSPADRQQKMEAITSQPMDAEWLRNAEGAALEWSVGAHKDLVQRFELQPDRTSGQGTESPAYVFPGWTWDDSTANFIQTQFPLALQSLGKGKFLKYDTQDVVFFLPYDQALQELLRKPWAHRLYKRDGYSLWSPFQLPAYMQEWTEIAQKLKRIDHVEITAYPQMSRVVYILLGELLLQEKAIVYDKKAAEYLRDIGCERYPQDYDCECMDGSRARGRIWQEKFFAHTPNTAYLYFYMRQDRMGDDCCMEEFPLREPHEHMEH